MENTVETVEIVSYLEAGEGTRIEFKEASTEIPASFYETVCSFLNKEGGTILLGVNDDSEVIGISKEHVTKFIKSIIASSNDPDLINPPVTLSPREVEVKNKSVIIVKLNVSSQVHKCRSVVFDRENDCDLRLLDEGRIKEIYFRKRQVFTESQIVKNLTLEDLDEKLFEKAKSIIRASHPDHAWLELTNIELLKSSLLYKKDFQTGEEGLTHASALIFGKDQTIQSLFPAYKVEAMVRINDLDRWDDRLTLRTNLIDTYRQLMDFIRKHLPERFFLEKDQRKDLREIIFREFIANIIVHREYTNARATELIIYKDYVVATNPNRAMFHGPLDIYSFSPYAKNPNIRKFFTAFGWTDEIGSGIRNMTKYLRYYTPGAIPQFIEDDIFKTEIPLSVKLIADFQKELLQLTHLNLTPFTEYINNKLTDIALANDLKDEGVEVVLFELVSRWHQNGQSLHSLDWATVRDLNVELWQNTLSWEEKGTKMLGKKGLYFIQILMICTKPIALDDLMAFLKYQNRASFRDRYLKPLLDERLLQRTIPDKPNSKNQQYLITDKGKLFLAGCKL